MQGIPALCLLRFRYTLESVKIDHKFFSDLSVFDLHKMIKKKKKGSISF